MQGLFPDLPMFPEGFSYHPEFLTESQEETLRRQIEKIPLHTFLFQGFEARRKVASFGYDYSFEKRSLSKGADIPAGFHPLISQVAAHLNVAFDDFAELLVTEYPAGSVINWHRDAPPFDVIAGISLLSDCIFSLRPHDKSRQGRSSVISVPVRRRSLYVISGDARSHWEHRIQPVRRTRYSITLRTLRNPATTV